MCLLAALYIIFMTAILTLIEYHLIEINTDRLRIYTQLYSFYSELAIQILTAGYSMHSRNDHCTK